MAAKAALKLVPSTRFFREDIGSWSAPGEGEAHSLHYAVSYREAFDPNLPAFFIERYSRRGEVVLDPFCGSGTTALESALRGRIAVASDRDPLAIAVARAKLSPADITEVTLALQRVNLRRPIDLKFFKEYFSPFFEIETFRELVNLRSFLHNSDDRIAQFIQMIALSLIHGHSAGFFSVYTFPQISLLPREQDALNVKRRQMPDYRAIVPRILRRTASILRDGAPSSLRGVGLVSAADSPRPFRKHTVMAADACSLDAIPSGSIDLIISAPPLPVTEARPAEQWLRRWFLGAQPHDALEGTGIAGSETTSEQGWSEFINGVLLEAARVTRPKGRVVFDLPEPRRRVGRRPFVDLVLDELPKGLQRYWEPDGIFDYGKRSVRLELGRGTPPATAARADERNSVLVLRRR